MKLTCVTAVFNAIKSGNRERLIRCVESVATLKTAHEHLIYDGGSTDGTVELLRNLERCGKIPHLQVVSEPDTGIYNALNKGVRIAKGEWLMVLGCDDYIDSPPTLDQILNSLPSVVQFAVSKVKNEYSDSVREVDFVRKNLFFGMPYCHQGVLMRTNVIQALGGFDERFRMCADYDLILRCHLAGMTARFIEKRYAVFSFLGATGNSSGQFGEALSVMKERFQLKDEYLSEFKHTLSLPLKVVVPYLAHPDSTLRLSATYMIGRRLKWWCEFALGFRC